MPRRRRPRRSRRRRLHALARFAALRTVVSQRIPWEDVLRDLSRVLPGSVFLQNLTRPRRRLLPWRRTAASPRARYPPTGFTVTGSADSQVRVALVLDRLALLPWLSDVTLQSSVARRRGEHARQVHDRGDAKPRQEVNDDRAPQRTHSRLDRSGRAPARRACRLVRLRLAAAIEGGRSCRQIERHRDPARGRRRRSIDGPVLRQSTAELATLRTAIPDEVKMSQILRQLSRASGDSRFESSGSLRSRSSRRRADVVAMNVAIEGRYFAIRDFLRRLRDAGRCRGRQGACLRAALRRRLDPVRRRGADIRAVA